MYEAKSLLSCTPSTSKGSAAAGKPYKSSFLRSHCSLTEGITTSDSVLINNQRFTLVVWCAQITDWDFATQPVATGVFVKFLLLQTREIQRDGLKVSKEGASFWEVQSQRPGGHQGSKTYRASGRESLGITKAGRLVQHRRLLQSLSTDQLQLPRTCRFSQEIGPPFSINFKCPGDWQA